MLRKLGPSRSALPRIVLLFLALVLTSAGARASEGQETWMFRVEGMT